MKKMLFMLGISAFLAGCMSEKQEKLNSTPVRWQQDVTVVSPENVIAKPDEEMQALQTFKEVPAVEQKKSGGYIDWLSKKLRKELRSTGVQVKDVGSQIDLIVPNKVAFGKNVNKIQNSFESALASVAGLLKEYDQTMVQIIGYTDNSGSVLANQQLSSQKAEAIATYLKSQGVSSERIFWDGAGPQNPVGSNETAEGREQNRRIEITLISLQ